MKKGGVSVSKISVMSEHLSNLIAAGEVVDRPMNIVKECVENSLDAHAASIEIEVFEGGISGLIITDDGEGMDAEDACLAFCHHATSKLKSEDDLFRIMTMGFRGEALASIAAVARVDLQTNNGEQGTHVIYEYGQCILNEPMACPRGTRIEVRGLFAKTPARLKYLKKANYEFSVISESINKLALSHPEIRFLLRHDGRTVFQTSGKGNQKEVLYQMYGREAAENALPFYNEGYDFQIQGLAVQPRINRASKNFIYITINSRVVRSWPVSNAVIEGYREFLPRDRYPIFLINIEVDPQLVDVNVHPNKMEVRLSKEEFLSQLIINTIENLFYDALETPALDDRTETGKSSQEVPGVQEQLALHYPNRPRPKDSSSDLMNLMNPNDANTESLRGDPHFDNYEKDSAQISRSYTDENDLPDQAVRKELRSRFNGQIPSASPYASKKNPQKLPEGTADTTPESDQLSEPEAGTKNGKTEEPAADFLEKASSDPDLMCAETVLTDPGHLSEDREKKAGTDQNESEQLSVTEKALSNIQDSERGPSMASMAACSGKNEHSLSSDDQGEAFIPGELSDQKRKELSGSAAGKEFFEHLRVIGQLRESYILCENPQGLVIIDQHAAQERCNFEKLQAQMLRNTGAMQPRMVPLLIPVSMDLFVQLDRINELTGPFGLSFEAFGQSQFILRQEPLWFSQVDQKGFIEDMFSGFQSTQNIDIAYMRRHMIATMACHSSIRFNRPLDRTEMEKVIWDLQQCEHPYHCPHGRPTVLTLSDAFLRKQFERS